MKSIPVFLIAAVLASGAAGEGQAMTASFNVMDFGATAEGAGDNTAAFQAALDRAREAGGGRVAVPPGRYRFDGSLNMPADVSLTGTFRYSPAHAGIRDEGQEKPEYGSVLEPYGGRDEEEGVPFITVNANCTVQGFTVHYPEQKPDAARPVPYPWCVRMRGNNPAVIDMQLLNPYKGIDASHNQRALIRNIHGQPLYIGIFVDSIYDIGRIENVHWNPWWSMQKPIYTWQMENGTGFVFGKTDWHYVINTFCFGYNVGYKFIETERGATNGNFLGIGADDCYTALLAEESAPMGILITNGEFVSFHGPDPTMIRIEKSHTGTIRFVNCAFWGPSNRNVVVDGHGTIGLSDCTFMQWSHQKKGLPSIDVQGGSILVRGCEFMEDKKQIRLGKRVERAIITENLIAGEKRIENNAKGETVIKHNVATPGGRKWEKKYRGMPGARAHFLRRGRKARESD
jgi:hypothetical protein